MNARAAATRMAVRVLEQLTDPDGDLARTSAAALQSAHRLVYEIEIARVWEAAHKDETRSWSSQRTVIIHSDHDTSVTPTRVDRDS
jgi:hypothetical protein